MKQLVSALALAISSVFAAPAIAWSPFDAAESSIERMRLCLFTVAEACPEGATCDEYGEVICGPGEECAEVEEEPDC